MSPQLIVFDLDGTLIDSRGDLTAAVNYVRGHYGLESLPLEVVSGFIGNGMRALVERSLAGSGVDIEEALRMYRTYYMEHLTLHTELYEGVREGLQSLVDGGHTLAILTNKPGEPSRAIINHFELSDHFFTILGGGDIEALKPDPEGIIQCCNQTGLSPDNTWMIGDHYTDLAAAASAGIHSAFVSYGFGEMRECKPDVHFASFRQLVEYFV